MVFDLQRKMRIPRTLGLGAPGLLFHTFGRAQALQHREREIQHLQRRLLNGGDRRAIDHDAGLVLNALSNGFGSLGSVLRARTRRPRLTP